MENKIVRLFIAIVSFIILYFSFKSFLIDIDFFLNKNQAKGQIIEIANIGDHEPLLVEVKYFNALIGSVVNSKIRIKKSYEADLRKIDLQNVQIEYTKRYPERIYLTGYGTPRVGILLFDFILIGLMLFSIYSSIKPSNQNVQSVAMNEDTD